MGHILLGELPRTRKWAQVVALIKVGAGTAQIAQATILAAERGLEHAARDKGVVETLWLLTQLPLAARQEDFAEALRECGLKLASAPSLVDVTTALSEAVDRRLPNGAGRTDLGEMAQMAAVETLSQYVGSRLPGLFGASPEDVQQAFAAIGTTRQFSAFFKDYFRRFTTRFLGYFLSRTLSNHFGEGKRFSTLKQQSDFTRALETHCGEACRILEAYSGQWFSKHRWESDGEISREDMARFAGYAMRKLVDELKRGAQNHGS